MRRRRGRALLASCRARHVLGIDLSRRVLTLAARHPCPRVRYCRASAETFALPVDSLDLVVSSLALHYVVGYDALIWPIASWLRPPWDCHNLIGPPVCAV